MELKEQILQRSQGLYPQLVELRRHLHRHPELSFKEYKTSAYLQERLREAGIKFSSGHAGTGIIALIEGKDPGKQCLLLRADMDALPIEENNQSAYRSENPGVMHACGHDVHSTVVMGATLLLNEFRSHFEGTLKIMFQPGEEVLPGGASLMIKEGVLNTPRVEKAIALHVFPEMETGQVGFREGMYMASTDELYVTMTGKGGHAAMPEHYHNPLLAASSFLLKVQQRFGSQVKHQTPTVVAFGKIEGKGATNVIPDKVELAGTLRTMDETWRNNIKEDLRELARQSAAEFSCAAELRIAHGYPCLVNDTAFTSRCRDAAKQLLGEGKVHELPLRMTAEDFAFITQEVPSCFFRLGTGNKARGITAGVHSATFDIDEQALHTGTALLAWLILSELKA